jgi:hypothetical protein
MEGLGAAGRRFEQFYCDSQQLVNDHMIVAASKEPQTLVHGSGAQGLESCALDRRRQQGHLGRHIQL